MIWRQLWLETAERLGDDATAARWLCQDASGYEGIEWIEALDHPATTRAVARVDAMVSRRLAGEPLQYVLGSWSFCGLDLMVDARALIPRPETEQVVEVALTLVRDRPGPLVVADLGTGSGAIALALAAGLPLGGVEIWATDVSSDALDLARANVAGLGRRGAGVRVAEGSWFEALPADRRGRFDLIVSNPPYVATSDALEPAVLEWEPLTALLAGDDGLDDIRRIAGESPGWLTPGGWLVVEIGAAQGEAARHLASDAGLVDIAVLPDLAGHDRILHARRPTSSPIAPPQQRER